MICANCKKPFNGKNFGFVGRNGINDICSRPCRLDYRNALQNAAVGGAETGVVRPRPSPRQLTPAAIKKKLRPSERDVSRSVASQLDGSGIWNTRTQSGAIKTAAGHILRLCRAGTPDRVAAAGLQIWIEIKKQGERPSAEQAAAIAELKANGALCFVIDDPEQWRIIANCLKGRATTIAAINEQISTIQNEIDARLKI